MRMSGPLRVLGFLAVLALVFAIPLGIAMGVSPAVSGFLTPPFRFFSVLAGIAWIPVASLWFGYGFGAMFLLGALYGFIATTQPIYGEAFGLGPLFPVAMAATAIVQSIATFLCARLLRTRLLHTRFCCAGRGCIFSQHNGHRGRDGAGLLRQSNSAQTPR